MHAGRFIMHTREKWALEMGGVALFDDEEKAVQGGKGRGSSGIMDVSAPFTTNFMSRSSDPMAALERGDLEVVRPLVHA